MLLSNWKKRDGLLRKCYEFSITEHLRTGSGYLSKFAEFSVFPPPILVMFCYKIENEAAKDCFEGGLNSDISTEQSRQSLKPA
jgi:hypothetical protein